MQCTEIHSLFTDFADNTLSREELRALTDHLHGCQACALEWREFEQTLSLVHSLEPQAPPADLLPGIQTKLAKKGIFDRAWALAEALNFSLSIPAAAAIFTIAMLAGFLLKTSPLNQPGIFPSHPARSNALSQGEILTTRRPPLAPNLMFAVSHSGDRQGWDQEQLPQIALAPHLAPNDDAHRLLSPDIHILIKNIDRDSRVAFCQEMLHRNWQIHHITGSLFLVHLPQADLGTFHGLLAHHHFALVAAGARFGNSRKVLTAAIRFQ